MSKSAENEWDFSFVWKIENYLSYEKKFREKISSPVFMIEALDRSKWILNIYPKGLVENYVACMLCRADNETSANAIAISPKIELLIAGETLEENVVENPTFSFPSSWLWPNLKLTDEVINKMKACSRDTLNIVCRMKKTGLEKKSNEICKAPTRLYVDQSSFKWPVQIFKNTLRENKRYFFLQTQLYGIVVTMQQEIVEIIIRKMEGESRVTRPVTGKITLLDVKGNEIISLRDTHIFAPGTDVEIWEFPPLVSKNVLRNDNCMQDEAFDLFCEFSLSDDSETSAVLHFSYESFSNVDAIFELRTDLKELMSSEKVSDVKLCVGDSVLPAHKCLLAARSPVFAAMFSQDMIENKTGIVDIADGEMEHLKSFLEFLYTGLVTDIDYKMACKLLVLADKYQVDALKEKCTLFLMSELSTTNVGEILILADMVNHVYLKSYVLDYIVKHAGDILPSSEWSEWIRQNSKFSVEILSYIGENLASFSNKISR